MKTHVRYLMAPAGAASGGGAPAGGAAPAAGGGAPAGAAAPAAATASGVTAAPAGAKSGLTPGDQAALDAMAPAGGAPALPDGYIAMETRPDWMPERFYDAEKKAARLPDLAKSWSEADKKIMAKTEDLRKLVEEDFNKQRMIDRPEAPDKYQAKLPDDFKLPEGFQYKPDENNPMLQWWRKTAHDTGMSQAQFETGIKAYWQALDYSAPDIEAEQKKLGENAGRRIEAVTGFVKGRLGEKHQKALSAIATSAETFEAIEALVALTQQAGAGGDMRQPITIRTEAELKNMQMDPRYRDPFKRDPAFVKEVQEGYKRLYGG